MLFEVKTMIKTGSSIPQDALVNASPERMATAPQRVFHISIIVFTQLNAG